MIFFKLAEPNATPDLKGDIQLGFNPMWNVDSLSSLDVLQNLIVRETLERV